MALKDILVHIDDTTTCGKRLEAAIHLTEACDAHLTGLYVLRPLMLPPAAISEMGIEFIEAEQESARVRAAEAEQAFKAATEKAGVASEWRCIEGSALVSILSFHSHYADLIVGGQTDEDDRSKGGFPWFGVLLPILYVLSIGPVSGMAVRGIISNNVAGLLAKPSPISPRIRC